MPLTDQQITDFNNKMHFTYPLEAALVTPDFQVALTLEEKDLNKMVLRSYDVASAGLLKTIDLGRTNRIAVSQDGTRVAAEQILFDDDGHASCWVSFFDLATGAELARRKVFVAGGSGSRFHLMPGGKTVITTYTGKGVVVVNQDSFQTSVLLASATSRLDVLSVAP